MVTEKGRIVGKCPQVGSKDGMFVGHELVSAFGRRMVSS